MSRLPKLSQEEITEQLRELDGWQLRGETIEREWTLADFASAIGFINAIALLAEKADHHPDILLHGWNKVRITLSTHDQGGLTGYDFDLAKKLDHLKRGNA